MKKIIILFVLCMGLCGCIKEDSYEDISIYTTVYPTTYIANELYGNYADIKSIYPSGADISSYKITAKQIKDYAKCDLFIYNGLSNEKEVAASLINKNRKLDIIDVSKGLEVQNDVTELWLSPANFLMMTSNVKNSLLDYVSSSTIKDAIEAKYDALKEKISTYDADLKIIADNAENKTIIVGSSSLKFMKKYGFDVIDVSASDEDSNTNISKATNYFKNKDVTYLFMVAGYEESETITSLVNAGATIITVPNLYTITEEEKTAGNDYIYFLKEFIDNIKAEVY